MADDLTALEGWVEPLLARLEPAARRRLALDVARDLRRLQADRMRAQRAPDGSAWAPRKQPARNARGAIKRKAQAGKRGMEMFRKLRTPRHLQARASADEALVQIAARSQRIARIHHFGLTDDVQRGGPAYDYPARPLIGFGDDGREQVRRLVLDHLRL